MELATAVLLVDDNEAFVDAVVAVAEVAVVEDDDCPRNLPRDFGAASDFDGDEEEEATAAGAGAERNLPRRGAAPAADPSVVVFGGAIVGSVATTFWRRGRFFHHFDVSTQSLF